MDPTIGHSIFADLTTIPIVAIKILLSKFLSPQTRLRPPAFPIFKFFHALSNPFPMAIFYLFSFSFTLPIYNSIPIKPPCFKSFQISHAHFHFFA